MFKKLFTFTVLLGTIFVLLTACSIQNSPNTEPMVDIEATANAMVEATLAAEAEKQADIEAAVQATVTAAEAQAEPVMVDEDFVKLTEEELANLIDEAVTAAIEASEEAAAQTTNATADYTVTEQEVVYVSYAVLYADETLAAAEELMDYYYSLYGDYADDAVNALYEIESELESIGNNLQEMEDILDQGLDTINSTVDQLNQAAADLNDRADQAQQQAQTWLTDFSAAQQTRVDTLLNMPANIDAQNRSEMVDMVNGFADEIRGALNDDILSFEEKLNIAQSGANANAALEKFGGDQLQGWSDSINNLTRQAARGETIGVQANLKNFSVGLPELNTRR